jgi:hypothetical protein
MALENLHVEPLMGLDGVKTASLKFEDTQPDGHF